jgi:hypothetical protein
MIRYAYPKRGSSMAYIKRVMSSGFAVVGIAAIVWLAGPAPAVAGPGASEATIATDVISAGGQEGTSASFRIHDTIGQGPIGPVATGTSVQLQDGFWATITAKGAPADTIPPGYVHPFEAVAGDTTITLSWTNPSDADFVGTLVIYKISGFPTGPTDGTPVPNGHGGKFYNSHGSTDGFVHTGLTNGTTYNYCAYAFDGVPNYAIGADATGTPQDTIPPTAVTSFTATPGDTTVILRWTTPDDADFDHALIRYSTVSTPNGPTQGTAVENGESGIFRNDAARPDSFYHTHLENGVTYYYSIWCADEVPNYSGYWDASATPEDTIPPGFVDYLLLTAGDRSVLLEWKNPSDADLQEVRIRYSTTAYPSYPAAGTPIENGNGGVFSAMPDSVDSFLHQGLVAGTTYYYSLFTFDDAGNYPGYTSDYAVPFDLTPPEIALSVFQNPYVTNYLDVYLIASEAVSDSSVYVTINDSPLAMEVNDAAKYIYRGDYDLCCTGALTVKGCARDIAGNYNCESRTFSSSLMLAAAGGTARSADGAFGFSLPAGALAGNSYLIVSDSEVSGTRVYDVSPSGLVLREPAEVAIAYPDTTSAPEHLSIARLDDGGLSAVDSYLDRASGRVVAYVGKPGAFGLIHRPDAVIPTYGEGGFQVMGNAPNPFVGSTEIQFQVARTGRVEVEIVSIDGRHVRKLTDHYVTPGRHAIIWDGCDDGGRRVAGGVYLCRAVFGKDRVNHKMVHLR